MIYEVILKGVNTCTSEGEGVGSVAGGGRYDNLVGMFDSKGKNVPCVGISIGVERIFSILEAKALTKSQKVRTTETEVYIVNAHKNLAVERMKICRELWDSDFKVEHSYKLNPKLLVQLQYCEEHQIPLAIVIGQSELQNNVVKIRDVVTRVEEEVDRTKLVEELRKRLSLFRES